MLVGSLTLRQTRDRISELRAEARALEGELDSVIPADDGRILPVEEALDLGLHLNTDYDFLGEDSSEDMSPGALGVQIGTVIFRTHTPRFCAGDPCVIHNPSAHPLRDKPMRWRSIDAVTTRICDHGQAHPDPDSVAFEVRAYSDDQDDVDAAAAFNEHDCDGCCMPRIG